MLPLRKRRRVSLGVAVFGVRNDDGGAGWRRMETFLDSEGTTDRLQLPPPFGRGGEPRQPKWHFGDGAHHRTRSARNKSS